MRVKFFLLLTLGLFIIGAPQASADWIDPHEKRFDTPYRSVLKIHFPNCPHPRGETRAFYPDGTHAIVGNSENQKGADIVFSIGNENFVQCFCPQEGKKGIQTNWLAASNLSQEKVEFYKKMGWYYIENGQNWGLSPEPYLAQNSDFLCLRPLSDPNQNPTPVCPNP